MHQQYVYQKYNLKKNVATLEHRITNIKNKQDPRLESRLENRVGRGQSPATPEH